MCVTFDLIGDLRRTLEYYINTTEGSVVIEEKRAVTGETSDHPRSEEMREYREQEYISMISVC